MRPVFATSRFSEPESIWRGWALNTSIAGRNTANRAIAQFVFHNMATKFIRRTGDAHIRAMLAMLVVFWSTFVVLYTLSSVLRDGLHQLLFMPRRVVLALVGAALSSGMYHLQRWMGRSTSLRRIASIVIVSLGVAGVFSISNLFIFELFAPLSGETCFQGRACTLYELKLLAIEYTVNWSFIFLLWGLLSDFMLSADCARVAEASAQRSREAARSAGREALRYQLNPHFLFNCLNGLSTLVGRGNEDAAQDMIGEMGAFIRASLAPDPGELIELRHEVDARLMYLALEQRRFPRLAVRVNVLPDTCPPSSHRSSSNRWWRTW